MRKIPILIAGLLITAATVRAQQPEVAVPMAPTGSTGSIDVGVRSSGVTGDAARAERYRDLSDGAVGEHLRFDQRGDGWIFESYADHLGRADQQLFAGFRSKGNLKASFTWDQIPMFISGDTRTLYSVNSPGVLRLDNTMRSAIQSGLSPLSSFSGNASPFDIQSWRHTAKFDLIFTPVRNLDLKFNLKRTDRQGTMPLGASFGFNDAVEIPAPVDTRTTDVASGVEWSGARGLVRVGYDGSWFQQNQPTVIWDNPLKLTDSTAETFYQSGLGGSQGRYALPPTNSMQNISTGGALKLPANTRLGANVTVGAMRQNEVLLPATINTAIPAIPLPRGTADAEVRTTAMNYTFSSQPLDYVAVSARYRYYDFDNRTPIFTMPQFVIFDQSLHAGESTEPISVKRQNADVDVSLLPTSFTAFRVGYSREIADRTYRIFTRTTDETYRSSIDLNAGRRILVRGIVERSSRVGSGFDEELLVDIGEQPDMRHFDIADRDRDRATGLVQVSATKYLDFMASAAMGKDDYKNSGFGLRSNENHIYTIGVNASAASKKGQSLDAGLSYVRETYAALQNSRTASPGTPQVTDPTRDWSINSDDHTNTWSGHVDVIKVVPRVDVRFGYDFTHATSTYVYGMAEGWPLAPLVQLPAVTYELRSANMDVRVPVTRTVALGVLYWHEDYSVNDFAFDPNVLGQLATPGSLYLGYVFRPYTVDSASVRLILAW